MRRKLFIGETFSSSRPNGILSCYGGKNRFVDLKIARPNEKAFLLWREEQISPLRHMSRINEPSDENPGNPTLVSLHVLSWWGSWQENKSFNFALVTCPILTRFLMRKQGVQLCSRCLSHSDKVPNKKLRSPTLLPLHVSFWQNSWRETSNSPLLVSFWQHFWHENREHSKNP